MSNIIVDLKINKGAPSIQALNGRFNTVKQVYVFYTAFYKMAGTVGHNTEEEQQIAAIRDTVAELGLAEGVVHESLAYVKLYPQILG